MYIDTPPTYRPSVHDDLRYGDSPLGRDIIGSPETVRAATRETFTTTSAAGSCRRGSWSASAARSPTRRAARSKGVRLAAGRRDP